MRKILFFIFTCILSTSYAEHITGGDFTISQTGPNDFSGKLLLFSDGNSFTLDMSITVAVFDEVTDEFIQEITLGDMVSETVLLGNEYYQPDLNLIQRTYTGNFTLSNNPNGYYITWERCCRNTLSDNVNDDFVPMTFTVSIPDPAIGNSSPDFGDYPNEGYICVGSSNSIDFSADDPDGDSLVYSLTPALAGQGTSIIMPVATANPRPYLELTYINPYSTDNYIGGEPPMSIDTETGLITAQPDNIGFYTIAAKVEEFRDGIKIGEVRREIQIAALVCVGVDTVGFEMEANGLIISATNLVLSANAWYWDFGDGNTSTEENPVHNYTTEGTYPVSLSVATNTNGTYHYSREITVEGSSIGISELGKSRVVDIYPNPANTNARIRFTEAIKNDFTLRVLDATANLIDQYQVKMGTEELLIDVNDFPSGNYFLQFNYEGIAVIEKLIIIK